jgi:hypothetical protein
MAHSTSRRSPCGRFGSEPSKEFPSTSLPGPIFMAILHPSDRFATILRGAQAGSPGSPCRVESQLVGPGLGCLRDRSCRVHQSGEESRLRPARERADARVVMGSLRAGPAGTVLCENQSGSPGQEGRHRSFCRGRPEVAASRADRRCDPGPRGGGDEVRLPSSHSQEDGRGSRTGWLHRRRSRRATPVALRAGVPGRTSARHRSGVAVRAHDDGPRAVWERGPPELSRIHVCFIKHNTEKNKKKIPERLIGFRPSPVTGLE